MNECQRCNGSGLVPDGCNNRMTCGLCSGSGKSGSTQAPLVIADHGQAAQKREADRALADGYEASARELHRMGYQGAAEHLEQLAKELRE